MIKRAKGAAERIRTLVNWYVIKGPEEDEAYYVNLETRNIYSVSPPGKIVLMEPTMDMFLKFRPDLTDWEPTSAPEIKG
jgi:hypothetical protein